MWAGCWCLIIGKRYTFPTICPSVMTATADAANAPMSLAGRGDNEVNSTADPPASPQPHASRSPHSRTRETSSCYRYFCLHRQRLIPFTHISTAAATPPANRRSRHIIPFPPVALTSCQRRDYRILFTPRRPPCHHRDRGIFTFNLPRLLYLTCP